MGRAPRDPADRVIDSDLQAHRVRIEREARFVPAYGADRDGAPDLDALAVAEQQARVRWSPRKLRWREVQALDAAVAERDRERQQAVERLARAREQLAVAPEADAHELANWIAAGSKGKRPQATLPGLERQVAECEREVAAVTALAAEAVASKARYVTKHRDRLVKSAREAREAEREKALRLIDELQESRDAIAAHRECETWALCFGSEAALRPPDVKWLCGARRLPLERAGIATRIEAHSVLDALRDDLDWVSNAMSDEQRQHLTEHQPDVRAGAVWHDTDEGRQARAEESQRLREQYELHWGGPAPW